MSAFMFCAVSLLVTGCLSSRSAANQARVTQSQAAQLEAADLARRDETQRRLVAEERAMLDARAQQAQVDAKNARQARARKDAEATAKAHGYTLVLWDGGLTTLLRVMVTKALPVESIRTVAVVLGPEDVGWIAIQVGPDGPALMVSPDSGSKVLVSQSGAYEGNRLVDTKLLFVAVTGVTFYQTVAGGTTQAFLIEPAW